MLYSRHWKTAENKIMEFYDGRTANYNSTSHFSFVLSKFRSIQLVSNPISNPLTLSSFQTFLFLLLRDLWCIFVLDSLFSSVFYTWAVYYLIKCNLSFTTRVGTLIVATIYVGRTESHGQQFFVK